MGLIYAFLVLGALTTTYPFIVMVTTGFKSEVDQNDSRLIPRFWVSESALLATYQDQLYAGDANAIASANAHRSGAPLAQKYESFLMTLPVDQYQLGFREGPIDVSSELDRAYERWVSHRFQNVDQLNRAYVEEDLSFLTVAPPAENLQRRDWFPPKGPKWQDYLQFKRSLGPQWRIPVTVTAMFQSYAREKFHNVFQRVPAELRNGAKSFDTLRVPPSGPVLADFKFNFLPPRYRQETVEDLWWQYLGHRKARDPVALAATVRLPQQAFEATYVKARARALRWEFSLENYSYVLNYLAVNGNALWVTAIYCFLAVVTTLGVNGLAAYALSRYPIRATGRIILFLLATMAFPAEVTLIPNFLLLKQLGLLNTYAALVLPAAASGYMVFLMKGFFDSLPQELFEAGAIDGAKELTMMVRIAYPLSKPVFGYFALLAFLGAYSSFIYAFLVAQDRHMWTVMVFLYQLGESAPKYVMMAAFTLAALPTLAVFGFAQRVIMRGIVLPSER